MTVLHEVGHLTSRETHQFDFEFLSGDLASAQIVCRYEPSHRAAVEHLLPDAEHDRVHPEVGPC